MAKLRAPRSFEHAITKIMAELSDEGAGAVIARSGSLVRKFADPDNDSLPNIEQALAFDIAFMQETGQSAPILETYIHKLNEATTDAAHPEMVPLKDAAMMLQCGVGAFSRAALEATCPRSEDGEKLSQNEYVKVMETLESLIAQIKAAEHSIQQAAGKKTAWGKK